MIRRAPLCGLLLAAGCAHPAAADLQLQFGMADGRCTVTADGRTMTLDSAATEFRHWHGRRIMIRGGSETTFGCLGPLISALERASVRRIGFISEPAELRGGAR